ncbi:MAG: two-component regulator propeller domain-containing protein [Acidobacteriota bacterium]|nr:two-component regulator propeller domain-containing protein [Acidobacteriota bacterium]
MPLSAAARIVDAGRPSIQLADKPPLHLTRLSVGEGLSQSTGLACWQDERGFMWFGTQDGLNRYDGYRFKIFRAEPDLSGKLTDGYITAISGAGDGYLWVGTLNGGLHRMALDTEIFRAYGVDQGIGETSLGPIFADRSGTIWVGGNQGLYRYDKSADRFELYRPSAPQGVPFVSFVLEVDANRLLVAVSGYRLMLFDRRTGDFKPIPIDWQGNVFITGMTRHRGKIWVAVRGFGIVKLTVNEDSSVEVDKLPADPENPARPPHNAFICMAADSRGNLWLGTPGFGLMLLPVNQNRFITYRHSTGQGVSLGNNYIASIHEDRSGTMWFGTGGGGVNYFAPDRRKFEHVTLAEKVNDGGLIDFVWSIQEDRYGLIWVSTQSAGVYAYDRKKKKVVRFVNEPGNPNSLIHNSVYELLIDRDGMIWMGTGGFGVDRYDPVNDRFTHFNASRDSPLRLSASTVRTMYEDRRGRLWIGGMNNTLMIVSPDRREIRRLFNRRGDATSLPPGGTLAIGEDHLGRVWVGTQGGGAAYYDEAKDSFRVFRYRKGYSASLAGNRVRSFFKDSEDRFWIGTDGGLCLLQYEGDDQQPESFRVYNRDHGFPNSVIYGILEDQSGRLWLSTNRGLICFDPRTEAVRAFDTSDGLQSNEFNTGSATRAWDGSFIFGGLNGFNIFRPEDVTVSDYKPPVMLTGFKTFSEDEPQIPISARERIELSHRHLGFAFSFAALDFSDPAANRYAYRLKGLKEDWIPLENRNEVTFTRLSPGDYVFEVRGSNADGVWSDKTASIDVIVVPPFWMRPSVIVILSLLVLGLGYLGNRYKVRSQLESARVQNELLAARNMQMGLMPSQSPEHPGVELHGICLPAQEVGGDFFDYLPRDEGRLGIVVADASARALEGAMNAVMASGMIYGESLMEGSPARFLTRLNSALYRKTNRKTFVAMLFICLDGARKKLCYACAGQPAPLLYRNGKVTRLPVEGMRLPLGAMDNVTYQEQMVDLQTDDCLLFYTDGLNEAMNAENQSFDHGRIEKALVELAPDNKPRELTDDLLNRVGRWCGKEPRQDDITLVAVKVN